MYSYRIFRLIAWLAVMVLPGTGVAGAVSADQAGMSHHSHDFAAMIPDGRRFAAHDGAGKNPADMMTELATELDLSGQQQQDLKILAADYGARLRDLAKLMRETAGKLMKTEPGTPEYWPLAQETSATAASSAAETIILVSEMREKLYQLLTADQRAELKRRIEERKARGVGPG